MIIGIITALLIFIVIILFSFPQFSPVPYYPTNKKDLPIIIKALNLKNNQTIIDLGAGDGIVIFKAAEQALERNLNSQFVAIEINPVLVLILLLRRQFHPNKKNIKIIWSDFFKLKTQISKFKTTAQNSNLTIYLYISPWLINKLIKNLRDQIKNFSIVSYMYPISQYKAKKIFIGKNKVFYYAFIR